MTELPTRVVRLVRAVIALAFLAVLLLMLGMVTADRIFSEDAFGWVDLILGAVGAGWLVGLGITVAGLLVVVMRALLLQATTLRTDLDAVI